MKAFVVMGRVFKAAYEELFICIYMSVLWWIGTVLVVTAAPATAGLFRVTNRIANYKRVDSSFFWEGAKFQIGRTWLLFILALGIPVAIAFNSYFYINLESWVRILGIFFLWLFVVAVMVGQYLFPLFWQQDEPDFKLIFRNAAILALKYPVYTFLMLLFQLLLLVLSVLLTLPLVLLAPALIALTANFALCGLLQEMGLAPEPPVISGT
ncbi:MAG: hypothetical protein WDZ49_00025 [Litorilinea sp.]